MTPGPEAHRLGPHVVGQRVVVRRLLRGETGPSGGPAMTDLLGTCTAWGDGRCVIVPESGDPVTIALHDIVSGKPVPPRPSVRHRVSPLEAQTRALSLWPDLETERVGDWLLRRSSTTTARRANSVLAFVPPGVDDAYDRVVAHYARPIAAVLPNSAEDALFRRHGWVPESHDGDTLFQLAGVARVRRALAARLPRAPSSTPRTPSSTPRTPSSTPRAPSSTEMEVLETHPGVVTARLGEAASGVAAYDRDWVGFRSVEVAPGQRRQGWGLAVMAALLEWGAERGATTAYLQVLADNTPALALYGRLGFATHHAYRYLSPDPAPGQAPPPSETGLVAG